MRLINEQVKGAKFSEEDIKALTHRIQFGGDEVVQAKDGAGSATLSMVSEQTRKRNIEKITRKHTTAVTAHTAIGDLGET